MASYYRVGAKWRAQIRRRGQRSISRLFESRADAEQWARAIEHQADAGRGIAGTKRTIADLLDAYAAARADVGKPITSANNTYFMHRRLKGGLAQVILAKLDTRTLVEYCRQRRRNGAGPYTVYMELSALGTALRYACSLLDIPYHDPLASARPTLRHLGLVEAQGGKRTRRPSADEWPRLLEALAAVSRIVPMVDIVQLAAHSTLRRAEICRIRWPDLDVTARTVIVRDRKHPRQKAGNDEVVPLVGDALDIIMRQRRPAHDAYDQRIFPYSPFSVSKLFTQACRDAKIEDLRLHDMRHEGTSRLFEAGWDIPEVAMVTGHRSWAHLKRYTNLKPTDIARKALSRAKGSSEAT
jgi:integrase